VTAPVRRNDPCPCGSGLRYKACHGRIAEDGPSVDALAQRALQAHQHGRLDDAARLYQDLLAQYPGNAIATHYLGLLAWQRGDRDEGERLMRAALAADATVGDFHNNLGLLLRDAGRLDEAIACFRDTLAADPRWTEAHNNLGLALEASGRWDEAIEAYRRAIEAAPRFAAAHQNLALALMAGGRYPEGLSHYRWRLFAQGLVAHPPQEPGEALPPRLEGRRFALRAEQGIGDALFFLRFAPELARRGATLAFRGDPRLHSMLGRTRLFTLGLEAEREPAAGLEMLFVGDLPWLLEAREPALFPPPLKLAPVPERVARWRQALGPSTRPRVAVTWRAGTTSPGPSRTQLKAIPPATLGHFLRERGADLVSVQRLPQPGERESLEAACGRPVSDASAANDDLEEMLALLSIVDGYVGVSNTNTHLRAALGGNMEVLVPHPPEWRWGIQGDRSPWFPTMRIRRQAANGRWNLEG
jgi:tetratricopeptide (TPR) repeat protein